MRHAARCACFVLALATHPDQRVPPTWSLHRLLGVLVAAALVWSAVPPVPASAQAVDCTGYDSQIWAQSVFETDPTRYAALDPDGNGLACEELQPGAAPAWWTETVPVGAEPAQLASVIDGDTIRVNLGGVEEPVRLILIDTPETHDPDDPPECYGQEATTYLSWLLSLGGQLYLESDVTDRDRYDRLLRYAWLDFGDGHPFLVNEVMVRSGYAALYTYPPDVKYVEQIREAQTFAREQEYGLWSGCITNAQGDTNELSQAQPESPAVVAQSLLVPEPAPASGECDPAYPELCLPPGSARTSIAARSRRVASPSIHPIRTDLTATPMASAARAGDGDPSLRQWGVPCWRESGPWVSAWQEWHPW